VQILVRSVSHPDGATRTVGDPGAGYGAGEEGKRCVLDNAVGIGGTRTPTVALHTDPARCAGQTVRQHIERSFGSKSPLVEAADRQTLTPCQLVATDAIETRQHDQTEIVLNDSATSPGLVEKKAQFDRGLTLRAAPAFRAMGVPKDVLIAAGIQEERRIEGRRVISVPGF
jgi:hypothetical protein